VRRSVDERKREACFFLGRPQGRALLRGRARRPDRDRGRTDRYVAELIGSGVDSEQAIRWLIAVLRSAPKPLTADDAMQNSDRARHQHVTSVETNENHKVHFLRTGADNYMVKPFGIAELAARCEVALRRYHKAADNDPVVRTGLLTIDLVSRAVTLDSRSVTLTRQEYRLLHLLASQLGMVITHNQLIRDIWGDPSPENLQYLRSLVRKLRQKIEADPTKPKLLISESGVGYRLEHNRVVDR
jgi:DNA-binding response OmpR family regulator